MQSSSQIITTNKPASSFFTGRMPFLSPNQQCQSTEVKNTQKVKLANEMVVSKHVVLFIRETYIRS